MQAIAWMRCAPSTAPGRRKQRTGEIVNEAARLNARTQEQVLAKIGLLQAYLAELQTDASKVRDVRPRARPEVVAHA